MNVGELKELLEDVSDDTELRIAHQPSWPLALTVAGVRAPGDAFPDERECPYHYGYLVNHVVPEAQADDRYAAGALCDDAPEDEDDPRDRRDLVWIVGIDHPYDESPYAPKWVFEDE